MTISRGNPPVHKPDLELPKVNDVRMVSYLGKWALKVVGSSGVRSVHRTRDEAIEAGRRLAAAKESALFIHEEDGTIQHSNR